MIKGVIINIRLSEKDKKEFADGIKVHNENNASKVSMTSILRDAVSKFIKKMK